MDLTTLDKVYLALGTSGVATDKAHGGLLSEMITAISARVEQSMRRHVQSTSRTVVYDVQPGQRMVQLFGYPVTSVTTVHHDLDRDFASDSLIDSDNYSVDSRTGALWLDYEYAPDRQILQVVYTGGMAATTAAFIAAFPDVTQAVTMQVVEEYRRRNAHGANSVAVAGDSVSFVGDVQMLPLVTQVIERHRCWGEYSI